MAIAFSGGGPVRPNHIGTRWSGSDDQTGLPPHAEFGNRQGTSALRYVAQVRLVMHTKRCRNTNADRVRFFETLELNSGIKPTGFEHLSDKRFAEVAKVALAAKQFVDLGSINIKANH